MSNSTSYYGLRPIGPQNPNAVMEFPVDPSTTAIYINDPVKFVADQGVAQDTSGSANTAGVAIGFKDSDGLPQRYYPAGSASGYKAQINIDPQQRYMIKCSSALTAADIGGVNDLTIGTGNTTTGLSGAYITTVTTGAAGIRVLGLAEMPTDNNNWGAYQDVVVAFCEHTFLGKNGI